MTLRPRLEAFLTPEQILDREIDRVALAPDASVYRLIPRAVVRPRSAEEVRSLFRFSRESRIPITFRAGGTSLSGQAITDGVLVDLAHDWRLVEPLEGGERVRVQPGVIGARVNQVLRAFGRKIGPDPASMNACMMGGILSNNSSGMCCGVERNSYHTLDSLTFVLPSGTTIDTADPAADARFRELEPRLSAGLLSLRERVLANETLASRIRSKYRMKNTTGYSLNALVDFETPVEIFRNLLIGSEGTLAFIAEAVLRTFPDLPLRHTGLLLFPTVHAACSAIVPLTGAGAAALELMDRAALRSVEGQPGLPPEIAELPAGAAGLLVEFQFDAEQQRPEIERRAAAAIEALRLHRPPRFTRDPIEQEMLWRIRKGMFPSVGAVRKSGTTVIIEDIAFPVPSLADAATDLTDLFARHGYDEAIVFGHARDGNLHFVITQGFRSEDEIRRYGAFLEDVVALVVKRYDGALKAEHGTGRNMAPFVETEWGPEACEVMREIKTLADPEGLLNPGVILNADPQAHLRDLKTMPIVEPEVDKCIECGYCEPKCPSRDLTTTPRQRIVIRREIERLRESTLFPSAAGSSAAGRRSARPSPEEERERLAALERDFPYDVLDTCAVDGLCATACPVSIDTGLLTKRFRATLATQPARRIAAWTVRHFEATSRLVRTGLRAGALASRIGGSGAMKAASRLLPQGMPRWIEPMPFAAPPLPRARPEEPAAVYFPSCLTRTMGAIPGARPGPGVAESLVLVGERAGAPVRIPREIDALCCGQAYSSKGLFDAHRAMTARTIDALERESDGGRLPVVVDTSPCTWSLRSGESLPDELRSRLAKIAVMDAIEWVESLLPRLPLHSLGRRAAVHPVCSVEKMGLGARLARLVGSAAGEAAVPGNAGCCGFAGDRGWLVPELTASATAVEASEIDTAAADDFVSSSRTCEIGMARATGVPWRSWIQLVEEATRE